MSVHPHELAILHGKRRVRYLKVIALFKIFKGLLLLALGFSLLFLHARPAWLDQISDWADDQLLLHHSRAVTFLLNKLQEALANYGEAIGAPKDDEAFDDYLGAARQPGQWIEIARVEDQSARHQLCEGEPAAATHRL